MSWPEWFNSHNWDKQSRSWLAQLNTNVDPLSSEWMPFSDLTVCGKCHAAYSLYRHHTDFYPPLDIQRIKAKALARIEAHHPHHPQQIHGVIFRNGHPNRWLPNWKEWL